MSKFGDAETKERRPDVRFTSMNRCRPGTSKPQDCPQPLLLCGFTNRHGQVSAGAMYALSNALSSWCASSRWSKMSLTTAISQKLCFNTPRLDLLGISYESVDW